MVLQWLRNNQRHILTLGVLFGLVILVFNQIFTSNFVYWDDDVFILRNEILKMPFFEAVRTSFSSYFHGDFLPLTLMSYWIDYQLFGIEWTEMHIVNLLFHLINLTLVYFFVYRLTGRDWLWAAVVTLVFGIHPLQAEPVVWISERKSLVSGFFTLSSLVLYLRYMESNSRKTLFFALACYVCTILAKTTAVLLPLLFFYLDRFVAEKPWKQSFLRLVPWLGLIGVVAVLRTISYDYSTPGVVQALWAPERILLIPAMMFGALGFYVRAFFWPEDLSSIYDYFMPSAAAYWGAAITALGFFLLFRYLIQRRKTVSIFFFLLAFLFLLPILHIIPRANYINDRYLYLPIIGFAGIFVDLVRDVSEFYRWDWQRAVGAIVLVVVIPLGMLTFQQSKIWNNNLVFWEHTVDHNPDNILARNALGLEYHERQRYAEAIAQFQAGLNLKEIPIQLKLKAINNLANIYTDRKFSGYDLKRAVALYETGIRVAERKNLAYEIRLNLAQTLIVLGERDRGLQIIKEVYKEVITDPDSRNRWLIPFIEKMFGGHAPPN